MNELDEELIIPYVPDSLISYLETMFSVDIALRKDNTADYTLGYLQATRDIINNLKMIQNEKG